MNESNSIKAIDKIYLSEQKNFWLSEIIGIENYFYQENNQRQSCSKKLSKYVASSDYIDKVLIVLSATTGGVSICWFTSIVGVKNNWVQQEKKRKSMIKLLCWLKTNYWHGNKSWRNYYNFERER